jgi:hypothetical protein
MQEQLFTRMQQLRVNLDYLNLMPDASTHTKLALKPRVNEAKNSAYWIWYRNRNYKCLSRREVNEGRHKEAMNAKKRELRELCPRNNMKDIEVRFDELLFFGINKAHAEQNYLKIGR